TRKQLQAKLQTDLSAPPVLVAYHPVTLAPDTLAEADALFAALEALPDDILFCYPNADAGSRALIARSKAFLVSRGRGAIFTNLDAVTYWSLLPHLKMIDIARTAEFRQSLAGMANPYGDGHASERIVQVLTSVPLTPELLVKRHAPLVSAEGSAARTSAS